jgi:hypothetical protein
MGNFIGITFRPRKCSIGSVLLPGFYIFSCFCHFAENINQENNNTSYEVLFGILILPSMEEDTQRIVDSGELGRK